MPILRGSGLLKLLVEAIFITTIIVSQFSINQLFTCFYIHIVHISHPWLTPLFIVPILITKWLLCSQNGGRKLVVLVWNARVSTRSVGRLTYTTESIIESWNLIFLKLISATALQTSSSLELFLVSTRIFIIINFISSRSSFPPYVL